MPSWPHTWERIDEPWSSFNRACRAGRIAPSSKPVAQRRLWRWCRLTQLPSVPAEPLLPGCPNAHARRRRPQAAVLPVEGVEFPLLESEAGLHVMCLLVRLQHEVTKPSSAETTDFLTEADIADHDSSLGRSTGSCRRFRMEPAIASSRPCSAGVGSPRDRERRSSRSSISRRYSAVS